ncbi:MAG: YaaA family protein [Coriobacteriia bacterium]|nr:YaaA family protein [Coriobacteriia bacterium]
MLTIISPAMRMRSFDLLAPLSQTTPYFLSEAHHIAREVKKLEFTEMAELLKVKGELAAEMYALWQDFEIDEPAKPHTNPALGAFWGIAYTHLNPLDFSYDDWLYAQDHLRIGSGLYGLLRPLDAVQHYRLEMQAKLKIDEEKSLARFWSRRLSQVLEAQANGTIVNLASSEYAKVLLADISSKTKILNCDFKILGKKGYFTQSTWAKIGRGSLARFITQEQIDSVEGLEAYSAYGFYLSPSFSSKDSLVFVADKPTIPEKL